MPQASDLDPNQTFNIGFYTDASSGMKGFKEWFIQHLSTIRGNLVNSLTRKLRVNRIHSNLYEVKTKHNSYLRQINRLQQLSYSGDSSLKDALIHIKKQLTSSDPNSNDLAILVTDAMAPDQSIVEESCCEPTWSMNNIIYQISELTRANITTSVYMSKVNFKGNLHLNCGMGITRQLKQSIKSELRQNPSGSLYIKYQGLRPFFIFVFSKYHIDGLNESLANSFEKLPHTHQSKSIQLWPPISSKNYLLTKEITHEYLNGSFKSILKSKDVVCSDQVKHDQLSIQLKLLSTPDKNFSETSRTATLHYLINLSLQDTPIKSENNRYKNKRYFINPIIQKDPFDISNLRSFIRALKKSRTGNISLRKFHQMRHGQCTTYYDVMSNLYAQYTKGDPSDLIDDYMRCKDSNHCINYYTSCSCMAKTMKGASSFYLQTSSNLSFDISTNDDLKEFVDLFDDDRSRCKQMDLTKLMRFKLLLHGLRDSIKELWKEKSKSFKIKKVFDTDLRVKVKTSSQQSCSHTGDRSFPFLLLVLGILLFLSKLKTIMRYTFY